MKPKVFIVTIFCLISAFSLLTVYPNASAFSLRWLPPTSPSHFQAEEIKILKKVGEIGEKFGEGEEDYFWHIDDLCCDDEGNLYVADSGWNKIFKFSPEGKFLGSFGREGQGPGEFMGQPRRLPLSISYGNDGHLYVFDSGNQRIAKFTLEGNYLDQIFPRFFTYDDSLVANSKGELIVIAKQGEFTLAVYNEQGELVKTILPRKEFYRYRFSPEPPGFPRTIIHLKLRKAISRKDHLYVVSNLSLEIFQFDEDFNLVNKFKIKNSRFENDFKKSLKEAVSKGRYRTAFHELLVDDKENLYLFYFNSSFNCEEMYQFSPNGQFKNIMLLPEETLGTYALYQDKIFGCIDNHKIGIYLK